MNARRNGVGQGRRRLAVLALVAAAWAMPGAVAAAETVRVVASFSILADMVRRVGGERVSVHALVGPDSDTHVFRPSPEDAKRLARADLVVVNGLRFEGWMERLTAAAGYAGPVVVATEGVTPLRNGGHQDHGDKGGHGDHGDHGDKDGHGDHADEHGHHHGPMDPHAWQDPVNAQIYVRNIARGLAAADPGGAGGYGARADAYAAEIEAVAAKFRKRFQALPADRRRIITSHDAFGYLGHAFGVQVRALAGLSTEAEPSARDVTRLIRRIRSRNIAAVFLENIGDDRLLARIAQETGATVGGTLYSDALSGPGGPAASFVAMMRHNLDTIARALGAPAATQ